MNDFDQAARYAVRHLDIPGFFRWVLGQKFVAAWKFQQWLDTQAVPFPGEPDLRCDTVAAFLRAAQDHPPVAVVVEFMSRTRGPTLRRMAMYGMQVQLDCPYQRDPRIEYGMIGAIVNLTGGVQDDRFIEAPPDTGGLGLRGKFKVVTLANQDARRHLGQVTSQKHSRATLVWSPLMRGADDAKFVAVWRKELEREPNARTRGDIAGLAMVFSELTGCRPIWKQGLEGFDVERSVTVMEWEQRGEQRGELRGELRAQRTYLLDLLKAKFGPNLPQEIRLAIESQESSETLTKWFHAALGEKFTLDELRGRIASSS